MSEGPGKAACAAASWGSACAAAWLRVGRSDGSTDSRLRSIGHVGGTRQGGMCSSQLGVGMCSGLAEVGSSDGSTESVWMRQRDSLTKRQPRVRRATTVEHAVCHRSLLFACLIWILDIT